MTVSGLTIAAIMGILLLVFIFSGYYLFAALGIALYYQKMCSNTAQRRGICLLLKGILTLSSHCRLATRKMNDKAYNEPDESRKHPAEIHIK